MHSTNISVGICVWKYVLRREDIICVNPVFSGKCNTLTGTAKDLPEHVVPFMISFTFAFEAVCSVYTLSTMLARLRNTWIIYYNKHIHVPYTQ